MPDAGRRRRIGFGQRQALAELVQAARTSKGWTRPRLARVATSRLLHAAETLEVSGLRAVTVTTRHVERIEWALTTYPLGNAERRARMLGIALALDLDRAEVNRIAGGI